MRNDLRDLTLLFVKTVGPEVFWGNFDCAGEQNYRSHLGMGFLRSYQSVLPNLAASLDARKRSDVMTVSKKERRYSYLFQPPSEIRPLSLGSDVTRYRSKGSELTFVFARTPYLGFWRSLRDRAFGLIAGSAFPEPPRVVGIRSRAGSFCDCRPISGFSQLEGSRRRHLPQWLE